MENNADTILEETIAFWERRVPRGLSSEDARQIRENLIGFFRLLGQWDQRNAEEHHELASTQPEGTNAAKL